MMGLHSSIIQFYRHPDTKATLIEFIFIFSSVELKTMIGNSM